MASGSLCLTCCHVREVVSARGSRFLLCRKSQEDERYAKYPPQPVIRCVGFAKDLLTPLDPPAAGHGDSQHDQADANRRE